MVNRRPLTPHITPSYTPQNGRLIVTIDSVTSLHPVYSPLRTKYKKYKADPGPDSEPVEPDAAAVASRRLS